MDPREYINKKFGINDGSQLLDPDYYSDPELQDDRFDAEVERQEAKEMMEALNREKEELKEEGVGAPPSEKEAIATEIESIDIIYDQHEAKFQEATDELALFRVIEGLRSRMNNGEKNYEKAIEQTSESEIKAEVRDVARDLNRDAGKINSILKQLKISTRITTSSADSAGKSKYVEEMERREDNREYTASDSSSSNSNRDRGRSRS